jgi:DivIVA domain-containing protein
VEGDSRGAPSELEAGQEPVARTELRPARGRTFLPEVTGVQFSSSRRGYDRVEVDRYVERVSRIVVELEAMRSPDAVIERALADVGEETSSILRRARKAAEEIIGDAEQHARSRADQAEAQAVQVREEADRYSDRVKADGEELLSEARTQAQQTSEQAEADVRRKREDADRYQARVSAHIEQLAGDRHRLIEDLRKLADQFHRTADRALEKIPSADSPGEGAEANGGKVPAQVGPA